MARKDEKQSNKNNVKIGFKTFDQFGCFVVKYLDWIGSSLD